MENEQDTDLKLSRAEILGRAESLAQEVMHTSAREALVRVRNGELEGSLFASRIIRLFALLGDGGAPTQAAAE